MSKPRQLSLEAHLGYRRLPGRPPAPQLEASAFVGVPELTRFLEKHQRRFKWCANCQVCVHVDLWEHHLATVAHPERDL